MTSDKALFAAVTLACASWGASAQQGVDLNTRALASTCAACHGTNGHSVGGAVGGLAGLDKDYFVNQMKLFKEGKREATLMHQIAKGYSDAEISALAGYFSTQKK